MGCTTSRSTKFITHKHNPTSNSSSSQSNSQLQSPYYSFSDPSSTPVSRTLSMPTPLLHYPPLSKGDSNHFVFLTSTTYGSLLHIDPPNPSPDFSNRVVPKKRVTDFGNSEDPSSPDSVINTWELMEDLDEGNFDFQVVDSPKKVNLEKIDSTELVKSFEIVESSVSKPLWKHLSEESLLAKLDVNVVSSYRKALSRQYTFESPKCTPKSHDVESKDAGLCNSDDSHCLLGDKDRIVLYYTSLRGIRKTYEDCCAVRVILRGFRVCVDEKDISMDRSYRIELQEALKGKAMSLPQLFIGGKCIGGAEEIRQLNESGELSKLLEGFPLMDFGFVCDSCGDARFLPCPNCNGSRKIYEEEEGTLRKCMDCNENGLIRCSTCCH